jgi:hypothetical protein
LTDTERLDRGGTWLALFPPLPNLSAENVPAYDSQGMTYIDSAISATPSTINTPPIIG